MMMMNTNDKTTARPTGTPRLSEMDKADGEIDAPLDSTMGLAVDGDVERKADLEISELLEAPPPPHVAMILESLESPHATFAEGRDVICDSARRMMQGWDAVDSHASLPRACPRQVTLADRDAFLEEPRDIYHLHDTFAMFLAMKAKCDAKRASPLARAPTTAPGKKRSSAGDSVYFNIPLPHTLLPPTENITPEKLRRSQDEGNDAYPSALHEAPHFTDEFVYVAPDGRCFETAAEARVYEEKRRRRRRRPRTAAAASNREQKQRTAVVTQVPRWP